MFHVKRTGQSAVRDLRFLDGSAPLEWKGRAVFQPEHRAVFAHCFELQTERAGTWRQPGLIADVQLKHAQNKFCGLRQNFRRALKRDRVRVIGIMFHVKQASEISADARPVPPPRCHSERSEESPNFKANPSSTCGDSSSQAPQNDKEKRNDGSLPPETTIVSRET